MKRERCVFHAVLTSLGVTSTLPRHERLRRLRDDATRARRSRRATLHCGASSLRMIKARKLRILRALVSQRDSIECHRE
jgi:hypothetical protein